MTLSERCYRLLLRVLPRHWRARWEDEAVEAFLSHLASARKQSAVSGAVVWMGAVADIGRSLFSVARNRTRSSREWGISGDLRYAWRMYRRSPLSSLIVTLTIAVAVAGGATVFGAVDSLMLRDLPFPEPDELVTVYQSYPGVSGMGTLSWSNFEDFRDGVPAIEHAGVAVGTRQPVAVPGLSPFYARAYRVNPGFFQVLDVAPALGRLPQLDQGARETAVSHDLWVREFDADPDVLGASVEVAGDVSTLVAVMPRGVDLPRGAELWVTYDIGRVWGRARTGGGLLAFARMKDDATLALTREQTASVARGIAAEFAAEVGEDFRFEVRSVHADLTRHVAGTLALLAWAIGALFLITCINVAGMTLARFLARDREIAVRLSLGAARGRVSRQLIIESLVLGVAGAFLGLALSWVAASWLNALLPPQYTLAGEIRPGWAVAGVGVSLGIIAGLLSAAVPVVRLWRGPRFDALRVRSGAGSSGAGFGARVLMIPQYALSLATLVTTGLLIQTLLSIAATDPGFDPGGLVAIETDVPDQPGYDGERADSPEIAPYQRRMIEAVEAAPGVTGAAVAYSLPLTRGSSASSELQTIDDGEGEYPHWAVWRIVSAGYFETMGIAVRQGREFQGSDQSGSEPVVVVSESMAHALVESDGRVLGNRIRPRFSWVAGSGEPRWLTVVGVADDTRDLQLHADPIPVVYTVNRQNENWARFADLVVRVDRDPAAAALEIVALLRQFDSRLPIGSVRTYPRIVAETVAPQRFRAGVLLALGGMALVLVLVGMFGVTSYSVTRRRRELAVRAALGARPLRLIRVASYDGLVTILGGTTLGLGLTWLAGRLVQGMLYGVDSFDPATVTGASVVIGISVALATYLPARRAGRVDPAEVLREE